MEKLPQVSAHTSLPSVRPNSNLRRALDDHLLLSEATKVAGDLLSQFPNIRGDNISDGFIGALASVLAQYPRQVALQCGDARKGIARDTKFLSIAEVVAWCEKCTDPMRRDLAREDRIAEQIRLRDEFENAEKTPSLLAKTQAWLDRTDPIARELVELDTAATKARREITVAQIEQANRLAFERECRSAGIDPARGISPSLLKMVGIR